MNQVKALLENYWIIREKNKELYHKVKRDIPNFKHFVSDLLGWKLIVNEQMIKIEKIPSHAESFMGITEFTEKKDYCLLCALLIYLDDKEMNEQFLLSEAVEILEIILKEYIKVDWTKFSDRKSLVRVMQFAENIGIIDVYDGESKNIESNIKREVLYENTGMSNFFITIIGYDIKKINYYKDFENEKLFDVDYDRGHYRTNRVYRQLITSPAVYWSQSNDADSLYIKNQRPSIQKNIEENIGGRIDIHKNAAFFVMHSETGFGTVFPGTAMICEIALMVCGKIRNKVEAGRIIKNDDDIIYISNEEFVRIIIDCKEDFAEGWSKEYREMNDQKLIQDILEYMQKWMFISQTNDMVMIMPSAGKFVGQYNKDYVEKCKI